MSILTYLPRRELLLATGEEVWIHTRGGFKTPDTGVLPITHNLPRVRGRGQTRPAPLGKTEFVHISGSLFRAPGPRAPQGVPGTKTYVDRAKSPPQPLCKRTYRVPTGSCMPILRPTPLGQAEIWQQSETRFRASRPGALQRATGAAGKGARANRLPQ